MLFFFNISVNGNGVIKALRPQIDHPDTLAARITGLSSNHEYRFYVWARTAAGQGESVYQDVKTKDGDRKFDVASFVVIRLAI